MPSVTEPPPKDGVMPDSILIYTGLIDVDPLLSVTTILSAFGELEVPVKDISHINVPAAWAVCKVPSMAVQEKRSSVFFMNLKLKMWLNV